jgi:cytochrome b
MNARTPSSAAAPAPVPVPLGHTRPAAPRAYVWDLPLRLFHWSLLLAVAVAIATGEIGGNWMTLHGQAGLAVVGLLAFRFAWGLVGWHTARFAQFASTPSRLKAYLAGRWQGLGHNPLGALSGFALLGLLAAQAGSGLFGNDEIAFTGPLNGLVEESFGLWLTGWHKRLALALFVLLALHVAAIVFHRVVKRHNLVKPMVTGWAAPEDSAGLSATPPTARLFAAGGPLALLTSLALALGAVWVAQGSPWQGAAGETPTADSVTAPTEAPTPAAAPAASATAAPATPRW